MARNPSVLLKKYDEVFTKLVVEAILKAEPTAVFCRNGQGMLGDGVVWADVREGQAEAVVINQRE